MTLEDAGRPTPRAVILDRDGVINHDSDAYIKSLQEWRAIPGSIDAIARLSRAGWIVAVCTNQSGIARGLLQPTDLAAMHDRLLELVRGAGGDINGIFVCPHGPEHGCDCRKPRPGLLLKASQALGFPLAGTPVIGDSARDLEAARRVSARPILVRTGKGQRTLSHMREPPEELHADLAAAVSALLEESERN